VKWDRAVLEECLEQVLVQQGLAYSNMSHGQEHEIKVFRVYHTHETGRGGVHTVCSYFFVAGKGGNLKVGYTNDCWKNRHRMKLDPKISRSKCMVVVGKFVEYCISNFWMD